MTNWTADEWDNLARQAAQLQRLLAERQPTSLSNGAYRAKLRLTIKAIAMFVELPEKSAAGWGNGY